MVIPGLLYAVLFPALLGYTLLALLDRKGGSFAAMERAGLSYGLGIGVMTGGIFLANKLFNLPIKLSAVSLAFTLIMVPAWIYIFRKKIVFLDGAGLRSSVLSFIGFFKRLEQPFWPALAARIFALLIMLRIFLVFFAALVKPVVTWDAIERYTFLARMIWLEHGLQGEAIKKLAAGNPYFTPISQAWNLLAMGTFNDALVKITGPLLFLSLVIVFYFALRKSLSRGSSVFFTYLLTTLPFIIYHAGTAYADFPQTYFYSLSAIYLFLWISRNKNPYLMVSAITLGLSITVKKGGISFFFVNAIVLSLYLMFGYGGGLKEKTRPILVFLVLAVLFSSPWTIFENSMGLIQLPRELIARTVQSTIHAPRTDYAIRSDLTHTSMLPAGVLGISPAVILLEIWNRLALQGNWNICWFTFFLASLLLCVRIVKTNLKYLFLLVVLNLATILYAAFLKIHFRYIMDGTLLVRLLMYVQPLAVFFLGEAIGKPDQ
ncbi:MAG: glycosyltransferase family 39 protein [Candidatus Margulisbacteria bacterium]|nr:glycosyltransferase family 39 protein [Candidatus Margulisiibacteriota bacterium]